jgi:hypothetical protein
MGRRPGPGSLAALPITALHAEIQRRQRGLGALRQRQKKLLKELSDIESQISATTGSGGAIVHGRGAGRSGHRRVRPKNSMSLVQAMSKALSGKTLGVQELAAAVRKSGYKSNAANFATIVNQTLIKNRKLFKNVSRGRYTSA